MLESVNNPDTPPLSPAPTESAPEQSGSTIIVLDPSGAEMLRVSGLRGLMFALLGANDNIAVDGFGMSLKNIAYALRALDIKFLAGPIMAQFAAEYERTRHRVVVPNRPPDNGGQPPLRLV